MSIRVSDVNIDLRELESFADRLGKIEKQKAKERKKFIRKQGSELRKKTVKEARANVNKLAVVRRSWTRTAGQYHKSIKRGRYYDYGGADCIRVYSSDKIAHLIELGFTPVLRNKSRGRRVPGKNVFSNAESAFEHQFQAACEEFAAGYKGEIER